MSEIKKNVDSLNLEKVTSILLDVAGTTTAINFVKDTLVPYVTKSVEEFLKGAWEDEEVKKAISQFDEKDLDVAKAIEIVKTSTEKDDSNIGLKTIQGLVFKKGYESGELKGHIFPDVPKCLESWSKSKKIAIFSTGSVDSQRLLFKNTTEGDLSSHISKYFDQSVGIKSEADSYTKIAKELDVNPENILFLTDDAKEAEAAKLANLTVVLVEREGNSQIPEDLLSTFVVIKSFADIPLESTKRKIEEEPVEQPPIKIAKTEEKKTVNEDVETIENEVTKKDTNIENKSKSEEKMITDECEEAMEVDVHEKSNITEKAEDEKSKSVEEKTIAERKSEEKPTSEEKVKETTAVEKAVKLVRAPEEELVTNGKTETETKSVFDKKPSITDKPATEGKLPAEEKTPDVEKSPAVEKIDSEETAEKISSEENAVKEKKSMDQEKEVVPIVKDQSESMEVEHTVENEVKTAENEHTKQNIETKKLEEGMEIKKREVNVNTDKAESMETKEDKIEETTITDKSKVPENTKDARTEIEIGTQTKTITNECETQTTISIKVAEDLPVKEVQAKLMSSQSENKKVNEEMKVSEVDKIEKSHKTEKKETIGDKIEAKNEEVLVNEEKKLDKVCESVEVAKKELVADTNEAKEKNEVLCKLEKTKDGEVSVVKETNKEGKENNAVTEVKKNNEDTLKENGVSGAKSTEVDEIVEEKENKSVLANGTDNCVSNGEASNSAVGTLETKEEEIKIKKIEEKVENKPVSVEA